MPLYSSYPNFDPGNPFLLNLFYAMEEQGWTAQSFIWWPVSLVRYRQRIPVIVFHFPNVYWRSDSMWRTRVRLFKFKAMVFLAKALGYKLVWFAHNVLPHDALFVNSEKSQRRWILKTFDLIVGCARNTKQELEEQFGTISTPYVFGVHGHYDGLYQSAKNEDKLIDELGVDKKKVKILLFLSSKPYKGQITFLKSWDAGKYPSLQLVLAGKTPKSMHDLVCSLSGNIKHISPERRVSHYLMADLHIACDIVALPYLQITTSGAYMLALTMQKPVLAPNLPFFRQHTDTGTALLYDSHMGQGAIASALEQLNQGKFHTNIENLQQLKDRFTWRHFASRVAPAFDQLLK